MMKGYIYLVGAVLISLILSQTVYGQRAKNERVSHTYYRLPIQKADESIKSYHVQVSIPYADDYLIAQKKYEMDLQKAEEEYVEAKAAYDAKSTGDKILSSVVLDDDGPKKRYVQAPESRNDIVTSSEVESKLDLQGFNKVADEGLLVFVEVFDYIVSESEIKSGEGAAMQSYAKVTIKQAMRLQVQTPDGNVMYDQTPAKTETAYEYKTSKMKSSAYASYMQGSSYKSWLDGQKRTVKTTNFTALNDELNNQFGYAWVPTTSSIYTGTGKKFDYSDLDAAQLEAKHGLQELSLNKEQAYAQLNNAITVWEKTLGEMESDNKKARINHKVGAALHINCATAYLFMDEFDKASEALNDVEGNDDFKGGDIKEAEALRNLLNDQRSRQ